MITKTKTLSNLNNFYNFMNSDPLSFNGMYLSCVEDANTLCGEDEIWDAFNFPLSREKLAQLALKAELDIESVIGTPVKPKWVKEEIEMPSTWFNGK